jgi:hypothetical protein
LQALAARFQKERLQHVQQNRTASRLVEWYPFSSSQEEIELLARLDLLP